MVHSQSIVLDKLLQKIPCIFGVFFLFQLFVLFDITINCFVSLQEKGVKLRWNIDKILDTIL